MTKARTNHNIDLRQDKERLDKAYKAFSEKETALEQATGKLVLAYKNFSSTQEVKQWIQRLKEGEL